MKHTHLIIVVLWLALSASAAVANCSAGCDADKDGVVDAVDHCMNSEPGAPVTVRGCAHDSDTDGVPDYRDNCLYPAQQPVDPWGCPRGREIALDSVRFETNSSRILKSSHKSLDAAADTLRDYINLEVEIEGHSDNQGSAEHNRRLSRQRAESVRQYLIKAGIDADKIRVRGYGESRPIASNKTEAGRNLNRRVVLRILNGQVLVKQES